MDLVSCFYLASSMHTFVSCVLDSTHPSKFAQACAPTKKGRAGFAIASICFRFETRRRTSFPFCVSDPDRWDHPTVWVRLGRVRGTLLSDLFLSFRKGRVPRGGGRPHLRTGFVPPWIRLGPIGGSFRVGLDVSFGFERTFVSLSFGTRPGSHTWLPRRRAWRRLWRARMRPPREQKGRSRATGGVPRG